MLTAGLIDEAEALCLAALDRDLTPVHRAELILLLALVALAGGDAETAERRADEAVRLFPVSATHRLGRPRTAPSAARPAPG